MGSLERSDIIGILFAALLILWATSHVVLRSSYWFEVHNFDVQDTANGEPIVISYDRTIHRQFVADWRINVRRFTTRGLEFVCSSPTKRDDYEPTAILPDPVTLAWFAFTDERCYTLGPGDYHITATWEANPASKLFRREVQVMDVFKVMP